MRKRSDPDRATWSEQLKLLQEEILLMPPGESRSEAERRARQIESAIHMEGWLKSGELRSPT